MAQRSLTRAALLLAVAATVHAGAVDREAVVREMLEHSRLLEDVHFKVPLPLWRRYVQETAAGAAGGPPAPVPMIAEEGIYHVTVSADQSASLAVTLRLRVFDPHGFASAAALSTKHAWEDVKVNGQPADLLMVGDWLRFVATEPGLHEITASAPLKTGTDYGGSFELRIPHTVRTLVRFESPGAWEVATDDAASRVRGSQEQGTHGQIALTPRGRLKVTWQRPAVLTDRPPRYQLSGAVAWNLDAAVQQVSARLNIAIVGGRAERLVLNLPSAADRVRVTGPDVRETRVNGGSAAVHLRGKIGGQTRLHVQYEMPLARTGLMRLGGIEVADGHWAGGTLVVTNTAGSSEVLAESLVGLRELALSEIPDEAAAMLAGPPVLACAVTSRQWSAEVDVVDLGEFALRESIADLAHYELAFRGDGTMVCKATYEIRNRTRQFLRLDLPRGATVLLARVNEKTRPLAPVPGEADAWLLPLIRSKASVKGLVTFPVELVLMCRVEALARRGDAVLPLPRIDLPIAYAWCEAYVPQDMHVRRWTGPLRRVEQYSSETAKATLGYGRGLAAEGYKLKARPTAKPRPKPQPKPEPEKKPPKPKMPEPDEELPKPSIQPPSTTPAIAPKDSLLRLGRNYYRAGKDAYEQQDYAKAAVHFQRVLKQSPKSPEAYNATRFLANIDLARGKLKLRSRAERAAGAQVKRQQALASRSGYEQQQEFLEKGLKAAREGRLAEAKAQFQAAGSLSGKLLEQGADQREQHARLQIVHEKLAEVRKKGAAKAEGLFKEVENLERKGDYGAALKTAQQLRQYDDVGKGGLRTKIEELTVAVARQKAEQQLQQLRQQRKVAEAQPRRLPPTPLMRPVPSPREGPKGPAPPDEKAANALLGRLRVEHGLRRGEARNEAAQHLATGKRHWGMQNWKDAARHFEKAVDLDPSSAEARDYLGKSRSMARLSGREFGHLAKAYFDQLSIARGVQKAELMGQLAEAKSLFDRGDRKAAIEAFTRLRNKAAYLAPSIDVSKVTKEADGYLRQAEGRRPRGGFRGIFSGRRPKGERTVEERITESAKGRVTKRLPDLAEPEATTARPAQPQAMDEVAARLARAQIYLEQEKYEEALADANAALRLNNRVPMANFIRGSVYMRLKKLDDAIHEYQQAAAAQPNHLPSHFWLARCYLMKDRLPEAIRELNTAVKIDPSFTPARLTLASAHLQQGHPDGAISTLQEALRADPKNIEVRRLLGTAYLHKGEPDKARQHFDEISRLEPDAPRTDQILAGIALAKGKKPRRSIWGRITGRRPTRERQIIAERTLIARTETKPPDDAERPKEQRSDVYSGAIRGEVVQPRKAIRGKVTAVDPKLGLVVLNAGQRAGVLRGHSFIVFRGSQYVGKLVVDEAFPDVAAAHYSRPDMKRDVEVGDDVTTRLTVGFDTADGPIGRFGRTGKATRRMYDVADLTIAPKAFRGRQQALAGDFFGDKDDKGGEEEKLTGEKLVKFIKRTITPGTWGTPEQMMEGPTYRIQYRNGQVVVEGTPEQQKQVSGFLHGFRQARGPQVQLGANIAQQRAQGQLDTGVVTVAGTTGGGKISDGELRRFIALNYDWQVGRPRPPGGQEAPMADLPKTLDDLVGDLSEQVGFNLGQKVQVSSINLDIPAQAANQLGANFVTGNNGVVYGVIDEAQFRTLMELDARKSGSGRRVAANPNWQDTIVGTDALLANGWTANVRFAADRGNTIDINDNPVNVEHDRYILIDNGSFLTAVRAGEMQHWMQRAARVQFAEVPQDIDVPRVGQMLRFEKSLVKPTDELAIRATYRWKGEGR